MHEDQGPMPEGDYRRLEMDRDHWKKQYQSLESVAQRTLEALRGAGRYLWHKPDAAQSQPCYDWCPRCVLEKARQELLDCLAGTMVVTQGNAGQARSDPHGLDEVVLGPARQEGDERAESPD